ncbi:hypothetical protein MNV49_007482 [Pseudohyphozyma bogoriensis]|nr:hypothetical protein MNV49_007482 [Pseudohyphozyma bogoriensis]
MGTTSSSSHCFECVAIQPIGNTSVTVTAIIADSCESCTFAHIDLEEKAFMVLGDWSLGTIDVEWEFVTCPDGYSEAGLAAVTSDQYEAIVGG